MAANMQLLALLAALCAVLAGVALAHPVSNLTIEGRVYCDTCRAGFVTSASQYIRGAKVKLECRHYETDAVNQYAEGVTDATGSYHLEVEDQHEEEICEVVLVGSPLKGDCDEVSNGRDRARILVAGRSGLVTPVRYANDLGFLKSTPLPHCGALLQQFALGEDDHY
ncbi:pollen-specific protein C13-like [Zingiber officinale]|uniref:pollen-specific protein C13-like n=1 Tax=Zingiber officinale TaxID=94328 RepID=UPI001C4B40ED|nr:pollen-specific protein C13-like [Zingiber officinale]